MNPEFFLEECTSVDSTQLKMSLSKMWKPLVIVVSCVISTYSFVNILMAMYFLFKKNKHM